jgi:arylsulfatase A-like enzyme
MTRALVGLVATLGVLVGACADGGGGNRDGEERKTIRLVDVFASAAVEGASSAPTSMPRTEWSFSNDASGWKAIFGVSGLRVEDGALRGTTAGPAPLVGLEWTPGPNQNDDEVHAVEVRLRASSGTRASFGLVRQERVTPDVAFNPFGLVFTSPIVAGDEVTLYTLRPTRPMPAAGVRHLVVRPTDVPGAEFAIESVRVIFEREHLASIPTGLSWQGLNGRFRETLVARSPEVLRFDVELPPPPFLEVGLGTVAAAPVTFVVEVDDAAGGSDSGGRRVRRTVTTQQRWDDLRVDLPGLGGKKVKLALRLEGEPGGIGLWGSPAIRSSVPSGGKAPPHPQGVIVLLVDTLRRDHLATWGYGRDTAPNLSRLAQEGAVADDAISQAAWTKVSVPSILTSLYPSTHAIVDFADVLPASAETLAEVFRKAGYATLGFSAIPFTGKMTNLHQGFEEFEETSLDIATGGTIEAKTARRYADRLLDWLDRHRDVPFFALLHVEDPHSPYVAPRPHDLLWAEPGDPERLAQMTEQVRPHIRHPLLGQFGMPTRGELDAAGIDAETFVRIEHDAYDALIRHTDAEIGRIVDRLAELGLSDRVVVGFTSDHGTEFLDHGGHFHGHTVYGELNRVPMFFWGPSYVPAGVHIPATVQNLDFMPTMLDLAGVDRPEAVQGQSLLPWFGAGGTESKAAAEGWRPVPAITEKPFVPLREPGGHASYSIIKDGWKLVHNLPPEPMPAAMVAAMSAGGPGGPGAPPGVAAGARGPGAPPAMALPAPAAPEFELFDHAKDPLNLTNVAAEHPDVVKELAAELERWRQMATSAKLKSDADTAASASPEELERLRALGYL